VVLKGICASGCGIYPDGYPFSGTRSPCFASHHFDAVMHLAAQTMVPFSMEHPREDCDVNLLG
jgi:hypothetical protein